MDIDPFDLAIVAAAIWLAVASAVAAGPVERTRVERFARRHGLPITAGNGGAVMRYLGVTRRWRIAGLTAGFLVSLALAVPRGAVSVNFLALFAGWFAGAVVAEVRIARPTMAPRRAASLEARRPAAYLPRLARALLPGATVISLAIGVVAAVRAGAGQPAGAAETGALALVACAVAGIVWLTQRRILLRPQAPTPGDERAADDAIRSRSLHVLAGGGATLVLYCVLGQLASLAPGLASDQLAALDGVGVLGVFAVPLVGLLVATARWPVRRPTGAGPATA
jgi:hypothetical protein